MTYGLIGEHLPHSYSKEIHNKLASYDYELVELTHSELDGFMRARKFRAINVTIPYKQDVIPYLETIDEHARMIGAVNTIVRRADGSLFGDNTDFYGMMEMARRAKIDFHGKKTLILGSGGTSLTAVDVVRENGGTPVVVSRSGENNYQNLHLHKDAAYIINTTPLGMYPNPHAQAVDLRDFPNLQGVLDVVYNPLRTQLLMQAEELGIPCEGGLSMLIYQGVLACEIFEGKPIDRERVVKAERALRRSVTNLVLIGMPGCGKSTIGEKLARLLDMPLVDIDAEIAKEACMTIPEIFAKEGEAGFRRREREQITRFGSVGGNVLVTGGGAVKDPMNRTYLRMNGYVAHITRSLDMLSMEGRPLSQSREALQAMWQERKPLYEACRDADFANDGTVDTCVQTIKEAFDEALCAERS